MFNLRNAHIEKDKWCAPFLLAASFHNLITFEGSDLNGTILYWLFSPKDKAQTLIESFKTKTEPHIPAKDLFEATEAFWQQVTAARNGEMNGGGIRTS